MLQEAHYTTKLTVITVYFHIVNSTQLLPIPNKNGVLCTVALVIH